MDELRRELTVPEYPRSAAYEPTWMLDNLMGPSVLWLVEALGDAMALRPGMRVLERVLGRTDLLPDHVGPSAVRLTCARPTPIRAAAGRDGGARHGRRASVNENVAVAGWRPPRSATLSR